jgi:hypothetical protein
MNNEAIEKSNKASISVGLETKTLDELKAELNDEKKRLDEIDQHAQVNNGQILDPTMKPKENIKNVAILEISIAKARSRLAEKEADFKSAKADEK